MAYSITGTTISLTRGDSFSAVITIANQDGSTYTPVDGDSVRFAMKKAYDDPKPLLVIDVPTDTMELTINPDDTKDLAFGRYVYDIQLTKSTGEVDTFIPKGIFKLTEEVY